LPEPVGAPDGYAYVIAIVPKAGDGFESTKPFAVQ